MKPFTWSFSKLKNYETCPLRHLEVDINKNFSDEGGEALKWGNEVHDTFHKTLRDSIPKLPANMALFQKWIDRVRAGTGDLLVEQKYAITKDFQPTSYFAPNVWYRGVADVVRINDDVALALDWKTGAIKVDSVQLMLMAQCLFSHFPALRAIRTSFIWLADDCETPETYTRNDVAGGWVGLLERVAELEHAWNTGNYPAKKSGLCYKHCPVVTCEHNGKNRGRS
jgi:hypothetical protein